jgi:hypothetical protein
MRIDAQHAALSLIAVRSARATPRDGPARGALIINAEYKKAVQLTMTGTLPP